MIPGANQLAGQINDEDTEASMKRSKAIILSMTKEERSNPSVLRASRKARIAKGSGTSVTDVNRLVSQFEKTKEQMRLFSRMANKSGMNFKR
jgi:signal recognition particle subunit SRP54